MINQNIRTELSDLLRKMAGKISDVEKKLTSISPGKQCSKEATLLKNSIKQCAGEIEHINGLLRPGRSHPESVSQSLSQLIDDIRQKYDIQCKLHFGNKDILDGSPAGMHIYHILHIALHEIAHCSDAESVMISLDGTGSWRRMVFEAIASNSPPLVNDDSLAYQLIKLRTKLIGGQLEAEKYAGQKAVIRCRFPFKHAEDPGQGSFARD